MNKFAHSKCAGCRNDCTESEDFGLVSGKIVEMLQKIRKGSLLEQADNWIRTKHYSADRLQIERLSGNVLPLDKCYINLAIIAWQNVGLLGRDTKRGFSNSVLPVFTLRSTENRDSG